MAGTHGTLPRLSLALAVAASAGCTAGAPEPTEASADHGHDAVLVIRGAAELEAELATSPAHAADRPFAQLSLLYRAPAPLPIEVATSADGLAWSAFDRGVLSEEASDEEAGVWVLDVTAVDGDAVAFRLRLADPAPARPTEIAVVTADAEELAAELEGAEDEPQPELGAGGGELGVASAAHTTFRRYRFDLGRVGRSFLWLLRTARARGWGGSLYGPRTGLRTYAQQASLWNAYQNGTGAPAFPPWGPSRHLVRNVKRVGSWYQAIDTNDVADLIRIARDLGVSLHTPYAGEPWHVEARRRFGPPRGWRP